MKLIYAFFTVILLSHYSECQIFYENYNYLCTKNLKTEDTISWVNCDSSKTRVEVDGRAYILISMGYGSIAYKFLGQNENDTILTEYEKDLLRMQDEALILFGNENPDETINYALYDKVKVINAFNQIAILTLTKDSLELIFKDHINHYSLRQRPPVTFDKTSEEYLLSGDAKYAQSDYVGAIKDYNNAIELDPNAAIAYIHRGIAKNEYGDGTSAIEDFSEAIKLNPGNAIAYNYRGVVKRDYGDSYGAMEDYDKAIELNPHCTDAYINLGKILNFNGWEEEALKNYNKAIEANPDFVDAYINRGFVKKSLGDMDGACLDWLKAAELGNIEVNDTIKYYCK